MTKLLATALAVLLAFPAFAQASVCMERGALLGELAQRFGEARQSIVLASQGGVIEMVANLNTGTWTALLTTPDGTACIVAHGGNFEVIAPEPAGEVH